MYSTLKNALKTIEFFLIVFGEFSDNKGYSNLQPLVRPRWYHRESKTRIKESIFILTPIHAPVIYQIPWISIPFRENSIDMISTSFHFEDYDYVNR